MPTPRTLSDMVAMLSSNLDQMLTDVGAASCQRRFERWVLPVIKGGGSDHKREIIALKFGVKDRGDLRAF